MSALCDVIYFFRAPAATRNDPSTQNTHTEHRISVHPTLSRATAAVALLRAGRQDPTSRRPKCTRSATRGMSPASSRATSTALPGGISSPPAQQTARDASQPARGRPLSRRGSPRCRAAHGACLRGHGPHRRAACRSTSTAAEAARSRTLFIFFLHSACNHTLVGPPPFARARGGSSAAPPASWRVVTVSRTH